MAAAVNQKRSSPLVLAAFFVATTLVQGTAGQNILVGTLPNLAHGVTGTLSIVSSTQLVINGFGYDGAGPDAFVYYYRPGVTVSSSGNGIIVPLPSPAGEGSEGQFRRGRSYNNEVLTINLPAGTTVCDIATFTIWCRLARQFFTRLSIPNSVFLNSMRATSGECLLAGPTPAPSGTPGPTISAPPATPASPTRIRAGMLQTLAHGVTGTVYIESPTRLVITGFGYDGAGPDAFVYYYRPGQQVTTTGGGVIVPLPSPYGDRDGRFASGRRYSNDVLTIDLPLQTTVCDIGVLTIWCRMAEQFFGMLEIPDSVFLNGVRATSGTCQLATGSSMPPDTSSPGTYENCEPLSSSLRLQWSVVGNRVNYKICGCAPTNRRNQYVGFGLSADPTRTFMIGADATIAWIDIDDGTANAVDYFLTARSPCVDGNGVCPDTLIRGQSCANNIAGVSGRLQNLEQCISYSKDLVANDNCDITVASPGAQQFIVWAIGGVGKTAFIHFTRSGFSTPALNLQRTPADNCQEALLSCQSCPGFEGKTMTFPEDTTFQVNIGPAGLERGYPAITGQTGWGIAWYVNGTLIPELRLERGSTYTFIVDGGNDPSNLARYHPFYITSSREGGKLRRLSTLKDEVVYAGLDGDEPAPGAVGRLCLGEESDAAVRVRTTCGSLDDYQQALTKTCDGGESGKIIWTPDENTPDVVYYQCGTHLNLGWRILVGDVGEYREGEKSAAPAPVLPSLLLVATIMELSLLLQ